MSQPIDEIVGQGVERIYRQKWEAEIEAVAAVWRQEWEVMAETAFILVWWAKGMMEAGVGVPPEIRQAVARFEAHRRNMERAYGAEDEHDSAESGRVTSAE